MKENLTTILFISLFTCLATAQLANDDCVGAIDYGLLNNRKTCNCMNGALVDTLIAVNNAGAIPNFPFYYTSNLCGTFTDTVNGIHNDVWYKVNTSAYFEMTCFDQSFNTTNDTALITFWIDGGSGCGSFWGGATQIVPLTNGWYQNVFFNPFGASSIYMQVSAKKPTDTTNMSICLLGFSIFSNTYCNITSAPYDSLCFIANVLPVNPSLAGNADGSIAVSVTQGNAPYSFLWNTGDTTGAVSNLTTGNYTVTITDSTGCSNTYSIPLTSPTSILGTGIDQSVFSPNPTAQHLSINIAGRKLISLYSMNGSLCQSYYTEENEIDVSGLAKGLYVIRVESIQLNAPVTQRLLVE